MVTKKNIARFKSQLKSLGLSFDWSREINTTDPSYYKWTQWIFLQLFKKGLAYKKEMSVNWCTSCKCVLANEEVVNGVCERCGSEVVHKTKSQWMLAITEYAQRLIDDLDDVNYIERVKIQQKNWIGRSTGAEVDFKTTEGDTLTVYTTRPDTLFGATYMVISPEHPMIEQWADKLNNIARRPRLPRGGSPQVRLRAHRAEQGQDRRQAGGRCRDQPGKRQADPDLRFRLRSDGLRHRRYHGRSGAR